jgi:hypothetical protein
MGSIKPHEKNRKVLRALNWLHTLKSLKNKNNYMARITTYLTILRVNVNGLNFPIKRYHLANWIKKEDLTICLQETHCYDRNKHCLRVKGWEKIYQANGPPKQERQRSHFVLINTSRGNNNYQLICTQCWYNQLH